MPRPRYRPGSTHTFTLRHGLSARPFLPYLASRLSIAVNRAEYLLAAGVVRIDGEIIGAQEVRALERGMEVRVNFPDAWPPYMRPTEMELSILYEDDCMVVLDKPPGIVVHPARGHMTGQTLQNGLLYRYRDERGEEDSTIGPAHRLDRDTSGVTVFGRRRDAYRVLTQDFATPGKVEKRYLALVSGRVEWQETVVDVPLGDDPRNPQRGAVLAESEGGKPAQTHFWRRERGEGWALIEAMPLTGRGHQIRLHLAHLGVPVIGDRDYHPQPTLFEMPRQALHAHTLCIDHPRSGERLRLTAPLPADMQALRDSLTQAFPEG